MSDNQDSDQKFALGVVAVLVSTVVIGAVWYAIRTVPGIGEGTGAAPVVASAPAEAKQTALGTLGFALAGGKVTLTGDVADEKAKNSLLKPARLLWGADNVVDKLNVKADAPKFWWNVKPIDVFARLKGLSAFDLKLSGNDLKGTATVGSDADKAELATGLKTWFTNDAHVAADIAVDAKAAGAKTDASVLLNVAVEFATGSTAVPDSAKAGLTEIAELLKEDGRKIRVLGHTDNVGDAARNKDISLKRAESIQAFLIEKGVPAANLTAEGVGQEKPVADNATAEGRQRNRRIEFAQ